MAQLEDLDDDCLLEVLDRLPSIQLFKVLEVNRRLERLATEKLTTKIKMIIFCKEKKIIKCPHINSFNSDNVLILERLKLEQVTSQFSWWNMLLKPMFNYLYQLSTTEIFMFVSKCTGVKSIEFSKFQLSDEMLLELVQRCPELECVKLTDLSFDGNNWEMLLDAVGYRIVHFVKRSDMSNNLSKIDVSVRQENARLLSIVAEKCPNIQRVDWRINWKMTGDLLESIKMLPNSCWRTVHCTSLKCFPGNVYEDVFDKLIVRKLDWNMFGHRVDRLSSFEFNELKLPEDDWEGFEFPNLKKLKVKKQRLIFVICRIPLLESFHFYASKTLYELDSDLFKQIKSVKKLIIGIEYNRDPDCSCCHLPSCKSIRHLLNLETIGLIIWYIPNSWHPEQDFLQQIVKYVKEIDTLKQLTLDPRNFHYYWGMRKLLSVFKQLKLEQNRVEIKVMI